MHFRRVSLPGWIAMYQQRRILWPVSKLQVILWPRTLSTWCRTPCCCVSYHLVNRIHYFIETLSMASFICLGFISCHSKWCPEFSECLLLQHSRLFLKLAQFKVSQVLLHNSSVCVAQETAKSFTSSWRAQHFNDLHIHLYLSSITLPGAAQIFVNVTGYFIRMTCDLPTSLPLCFSGLVNILKYVRAAKLLWHSYPNFCHVLYYGRRVGPRWSHASFWNDRAHYKVKTTDSFLQDLLAISAYRKL